MTNEEAKVFLDNLKICINEHPIVADWLVEIADRKTEPQTERSCTNCKHNGVLSVPKCDECNNMDKHEFIKPQTDCAWK